MDRDRQRQEAVRAWNESAAGWERGADNWEREARPLTDWLVAAAAPGAGETALELAAGPGSAGFALAPLLAPGRLLSTDAAPAMVEAARRRAGALGVGNVDFRVVDAERIDLPDAAVDIVVCRLGYMLVADPAAALRESRRVLRPGGRLAAVVWSTRAENPWMGAYLDVLERRGAVEPAPAGAPGPFALADRDRLAGLVTAAGFDSVRIERIVLTMRAPGFEAWLEHTLGLSGTLRRVLAEARAAGTEADLLADIRAAYEPMRDGAGYALPAAALGVAAAAP